MGELSYLWSGGQVINLSTLSITINLKIRFENEEVNSHVQERTNLVYLPHPCPSRSSLSCNGYSWDCSREYESVSQVVPAVRNDFLFHILLSHVSSLSHGTPVEMKENYHEKFMNVKEIYQKKTRIQNILSLELS